MSIIDRCCGTCKHSYKHRDSELLSCGHGVDDEALANAASLHFNNSLVVGPIDNPIWAQRKYGFARIAAAFQGLQAEIGNTDCEAMDPEDGQNCSTWGLDPAKLLVSEEWINNSHVGERLEMQISNYGRHRYRRIDRPFDPRELHIATSDWIEGLPSHHYI